MAAEPGESVTRPHSSGLRDGGAFGLLDGGVGITVVVLPADVLAEPIDFSDDRPGQILPGRFEGVTANGVEALSGETCTSATLIRFAPDDQRR